MSEPIYDLAEYSIRPGDTVSEDRKAMMIKAANVIVSRNAPDGMVPVLVATDESYGARAQSYFRMMTEWRYEAADNASR